MVVQYKAGYLVSLLVLMSTKSTTTQSGEKLLECTPSLNIFYV